jgi:hypothetical protein
MFLTLVVLTCLAALVAGVVLLTFRALGRRPPKYLLAAAIGLAVIGYVTYSRYTWAERYADRLPQDIVVVERFRASSPFEPWTYAWPRVTRFAAVDTATVAAHPARTGLYLVEMRLFAEHAPTVTVPQVVDCQRGRRASLPAGASLDPETLPERLAWRDGRTPPALFDAVCAGRS